jgi:hypothetical protein
MQRATAQAKLFSARFPRPSSVRIRPSPAPPAKLANIANLPPQPQHTGSPSTIGETALLRRPGSWLDVIVQVRGLDADMASVLIRDRTEIVPLNWLRRK